MRKWLGQEEIVGEPGTRLTKRKGVLFKSRTGVPLSRRGLLSGVNDRRGESKDEGRGEGSV